MGRFSRGGWRALGLLLAAPACGLTIACGDSNGDGGQTPAPDEHVARLTIGVAQDAGPLNVYTSDSRFDFLVELVYDKLFAPSPYVEAPTPWLAESAIALDPATWEVRLRRGITWHDGNPFTSADVKFTLEYFRDGPANRHTHHVSEVPRIESIEALDDYRLRLRCATPCPLLRDVTLADLPILPKHVWEGVSDPRRFSALPMGTGPYQLVEYAPGQRFRFQANAQYFSGRPLVDELVVAVIPDQSGMFIALRTGEIDVSARPLPPELWKQFEGVAALATADTHALSITEVRMNYERPPLNNPSVRLALSLGIDRQALVDTVLLGQGRPANLGYPHPDSPWTNPMNRAPLDRPRARSLLDVAGLRDADGDGVRELPDGRRLALTLKVAATEPAHLRAAELLQRQLADIGVSISIESADQTAITKLFTTREFDLYLTEIGPHGVADPDQFVMSHRSGYLWKKGLPYPEMDGLIGEYLAAPDAETRRLVLFQMQTGFNERPTSLALYYPRERWAFRSSAFRGWVESPGFGIVHKWSFLPAEARRGVTTHELTQ